MRNACAISESLAHAVGACTFNCCSLHGLEFGSLPHLRPHLRALWCASGLVSSNKYNSASEKSIAIVYDFYGSVDNMSATLWIVASVAA
eukprot:6434050-Amphidinium_carterae.1